MDLTKKKNRIFMFLITWFLGIFGVHWFVQKNYKKGCIYFITIGGFAICWIYDTFKAFMNIFKNDLYFENVSPINEQMVTKQSSHDSDSNTNHDKLNNIIFKQELSDYKKAVFLYSQDKKQIRDNSKYPQYIFYELEITNPKKFHLRMLEENYFKMATLDEILSSYRVNELKDILKSHNLKISGKKDILISRIINEISPNELEEIKNNSSLLTLTKKGKEFISNHFDYIEFHKKKNWGIDLNEYLMVKKNLPFKGSFNDVAWGIFNQKSNEYYFSKDFSLLRNTFLHMSELLKDENRSEQSYEYLLKVLYMDISGVCQDDIKYYYDGIYSKNDLKENVKKYSRNMFMFAPAIMHELILNKSLYSDSLVDNIFSTIVLPYNCCTNQLFKNIMHEMFASESFDTAKYTEILKNNYLKIINNL